MNIRRYNYEAGKPNGVAVHEDGSVETLYGVHGCNPHTKYVTLPDEYGGGQGEVVRHMKQDCPSEDCDDNHSMLLLAHPGMDGKGQLVVIECAKNGFLWCTL